MKFRDGMWLVAEDKTVQYAEEVYGINERENGRALSLLCPTRKIMSRGDTLNMSTLHIDIEAQLDGVISVEVTHFIGAQKKGPHFDLYPSGRPECKASISKSDKGTTLISGSLSATIHSDQHTFDIRFHDTDGSRELTSLLNRSVGLAYSPALSNPKQVEDLSNIKHYIFTQTELGVGESIHGLGERFGAWNRVGQSIEIWNEDGGTSSEQAYKNVPFWLSSRGYGVFIDTPEKIELEIGSERSCRLQTSVEAQRLKWYIINGPTPKEVLSRYSLITGRPGTLPAWSYGLWLSTSFTTSYDEATVTHFLTEMRTRHIPVEVFHFDCFWLRAFHWCDFIFDSAAFPDPGGFISRIKEAGLVKKVSVWTNPYIGQASPVFRELAEKGFLVKRSNGDVWQWDLWQTGMGLIDFTNPGAVKWYEECLERLYDFGVDCIKTDFGERVPTRGVKWFDESLDPVRMHNFYAFIYNKIVFESLERRYGKGEAVLFARTATAGTQRFPLHWGGDCESTAPALAESIRGGMSLGLSGFSSWSNDIGGFEGSPPPWLYKRWLAFGLLCTHSRLHGSNSYRVPWSVDPDVDPDDKESCTSVLRFWTGVKRRLMPYLFAQAKVAIEHGWPTSVRSCALEFPEDPTAWFLDRQFMIGDSLLVAPVFEESGDTQVYLPPGRWFSFWDGTEVQGSCWRREKHGVLSVPMYVREGAVLVLGKDGEGSFAHEWLEGGGEVSLYGVKDGVKAGLVDQSGAEKGSLVVEGGETKGMENLKGDWKVERFG